MVTQVSRFMYRTPVPGYPPISKIGYSSHFLRLNRAARDWVSRSVGLSPRITAVNCFFQNPTPAVPALNSYFPLIRQPVLTLEYSREPPAGLLRSAAHRRADAFMSGSGTKRTSPSQSAMSAFGGKA